MIEIYGKPQCPYCDKRKFYVKEKGTSTLTKHLMKITLEKT